MKINDEGEAMSKLDFTPPPLGERQPRVNPLASDRISAFVMIALSLGLLWAMPVQPATSLHTFVWAVAAFGLVSGSLLLVRSVR